MPRPTPPRRPSSRRPPRRGSSKSSRPRSRRRGGARRWLARAVGLGALLGVLAAGLYTLYLDHTIRSRFEGRRWALAARVYGRALELFPGERLDPDRLVRELERLRYRREASGRPGTYAAAGGSFTVHTRPFAFWDGREPARDLRVSFADGAVARIADDRSGRPLALARLDPPLIGSIYPEHREDRILVRLADVPPLLPAALVAVEDRHFYDHFGLDLRAIGRALVANVRAGAVVQGGSTLTQQLVKNYFLTAEQTLGRKAVEAVMAVLLEAHYDKDEILEAYLNEIYLGQQAARGIYGVGLASQFYFDRPVAELDLPRIALLVALVRGPSQYDPRRHPDRARRRRDLVLDLLAERGVIDADAAREAKRAPLAVTASPAGGESPYPAYLDLVQRQLRRDYREEDLRSEGLRIFTPLDPRLQDAAERAMAGRLADLERERGLARGTLEGASVVVHPETGEVVAVVGSREARYPGFNRALDAVRPIGSLVKPAVYLTALEEPEHYTLATRISDAPIEVEREGGRVWTPANYDHETHGEVTLYEALVHSYNLSTVRLGLEVGLPRVLDTLARLGVERSVPAYPSALLGAVELSPLEVSQLYQTLASGGFRTPLRAIREVVTADGEPLQRYPLTVEQAVPAGAAYLVTAALQGVVREGTGAALGRMVDRDLGVAGKTGTTDDLRDSWFAGFTGDWLAVVWLGRDDDEPTGLTGSTGALRVWGDLLRDAGGEALAPVPPDDVERVWIDRHSGLRSEEGADGAVLLPFYAGSAPEGRAPGTGGLWGRVRAWFRP